MSDYKSMNAKGFRLSNIGGVETLKKYLIKNNPVSSGLSLVGFNYTTNNCTNISSLISGCQNYSVNLCLNCSSGFMLNSLVTPANCTPPLSYVTTHCDQMTSNPSGNILTWSSTLSTILTCKACNELTSAGHERSTQLMSV